MIEIMILYDGPEVFSLCQDIQHIVPNLSTGSLKQILKDGGTLMVTDAQLFSLLGLTKMYNSLEVGPL